MKHREPIKNIMSEDVVAADYTNKFSDIRKLMIDEYINHVPIVSENKLVGIISRIDILKALHSDIYIKNSGENAQSLDNVIEIEDIMTPNPHTIKAHDTVEHAVQLFDRFDFNALPVVNDEGSLVGIITTKDIIGYLLKQY